MCGIVGFFGDGSKHDLDAMMLSVAHRGPDGEGFEIDHLNQIYIGHRRLAIRDAVGGVQPMCSDDKNFILTYNGELYNDIKLRSELSSLGHRFTTNSDTEVVLRSLIEWGESAVVKFDGQFAFCFVDKLARRAILARDSFGEKPLFWSSSQDSFRFASESSALARHSLASPSLNTENCLRFLIIGYLPPPFSILKDVQQVRPGHLMSINLEKPFRYREESYQKAAGAISPLQLVSTGTTLGANDIEISVTSRSISDAKVGLLLSGGVDSSLVAAYARSGDRISQTFTAAFRSFTYDESLNAADVATKFNLENHQLVADDMPAGELVRVLRMLDEPNGDSSYFPTFQIFKLAKTRCKVLLTGDGADELYFGYEPFRIARVSESLSRLTPAWISRSLSKFFSRLPRTSSYMNRLDVLGRFFDGMSVGPTQRVAVWMSSLRTYEWGRFFAEAPDLSVIFSYADEIDSQDNYPEWVRQFFIKTYLPGSVLSKSDSASMANGVESRTIFFHPRIVQYALTRSVRQEIRAGRGKQTLRRLASEVGLTNVSRRRKHGFAFPITEALRRLDREVPIANLDFLNQDEVRKEWKKLQEGRPCRAQFLWALLALVNSRAYRVTQGL